MSGLQLPSLTACCLVSVIPVAVIPFPALLVGGVIPEVLEDRPEDGHSNHGVAVAVNDL